MGTTQSGGAVEERKETDEKTNTGLDEHVAATISYVLGWVTGIIMFLVESDNDQVRFHAAQSIVVFGGLTIIILGVNFLVALGATGFLGFLLGGILGLVSFLIWIFAVIIWLYLLIRTYQGQNPRIPGAAGIADGFA